MADEKWWKLPLLCGRCGKTMTVLEVAVNKDGMLFDLICIPCGSTGFYVANFERIIENIIKLEKRKRGEDGGKKEESNEDFDPPKGGIE